MLGYKLFRKRKDGTYGPLFINRSQVIRTGITYPAEDHPTRGYSHRPGWHICRYMHAPHLSTRDRVWCLVEFEHQETLERPASQGGTWYLGRTIRILEEKQVD